jgi:hypothetical protein
MARSDSQNPYPREWRILYRAAISETNPHEMSKKISDAEEVIVERVRETFRETGLDAQAEREALDDAIYALRA